MKQDALLLSGLQEQLTTETHPDLRHFGRNLNSSERPFRDSRKRLVLPTAWIRGGQVQVKSCAVPIGGLGPQAPTVRLND